MTIEQLIEKKRQYNNLLEKLDIIQKNINNSINEIALGIEHYEGSYTIDEELADKSVLLKVKTNLEEINKRIVTMKYKINSKITNIDSLMDDYYNSSTTTDSNTSNSNHSSNNNNNNNKKSSKIIKNRNITIS